MSLKIVHEYRSVKAVIVRTSRCPRCDRRSRKQRTFSYSYGDFILKPLSWRPPGARYGDPRTRGMSQAEAVQWVDSQAAAWMPDHNSFIHDRCA